MVIKNRVFFIPVFGLILLPQPILGQGTATDGTAKARSRAVTAADALAYFNQRDWSRAVDGYEKYLATNPHDGQHWANYGFSLYSLQRYDDAIKAFEKQAELGVRPGTANYNIACSLALAGRKEKAIEALQRALASGFDQEALLFSDTDLDSLRDDARFKKLLGTAPEGLSREKRWAYDFDFLISRMERVHYNLYAKVTREKFRSAVNELKGRVPSLKDEEIAVGIQSAIAQVGDGHTVVAFEPRAHQRRRAIRSICSFTRKVSSCAVPHLSMRRSPALRSFASVIHPRMRRCRKSGRFARTTTRWASSFTARCI